MFLDRRKVPHIRPHAAKQGKRTQRGVKIPGLWLYNRFRSVSGIFLLILVSQLGPRPPLLHTHTLFIYKLSSNQPKTITVV